MTAVLAVILTVLVILHGSFSWSYDRQNLDNTDNFKNLWGTYTLYSPGSLYKPPPSHCEVTQVQILQRYGSRYPKDGYTAHIKAALSKLQAAANYTDPSLAFLNDYRYNLGIAPLAPLGAQEMYDAGRTTYERYQHLIRRNDVPFVRCGSPNSADSATNWTADTNASIHLFPCPAAKDPGPLMKSWMNIFVPHIRDRLSSSTLLTAEQTSAFRALSNKDIIRLLKLCTYENIVFRKSPFCDLFVDDFEAFDYLEDLETYYQAGYGQPLGPAQGVGYVNELIARLTSSSVKDGTKINQTLDSDPSTFPLNWTVYVDFSHRGLMAAVYSALGLFKIPKHLDPTTIQRGHKWKASKPIHFGGRMVAEKMNCQGEDKIRILVNDRVMPLNSCGG